MEKTNHLVRLIAILGHKALNFEEEPKAQRGVVKEVLSTRRNGAVHRSTINHCFRSTKMLNTGALTRMPLTEGTKTMKMLLSVWEPRPATIPLPDSCWVSTMGVQESITHRVDGLSSWLFYSSLCTGHFSTRHNNTQSPGTIRAPRHTRTNTPSIVRCMQKLRRSASSPHHFWTPVL